MKIAAHPIPSIITFRLLATVTRCDTLQAQLTNDLREVLSDVRSMSPDFYRSADKSLAAEKDRTEDKKAGKEGPRLVQEGTLTAGIVLGLGPRGWKCAREPMSGARYADIKARHSRFGEDQALVEVKIWPRNHKDIHEQVTDYFTKGVKAFATVMFIERKEVVSKEEYAQACLENKVDSHAWHPLGPPLDGYFEAKKGPHVVHHFLLRLPTRR